MLSILMQDLNFHRNPENLLLQISRTTSLRPGSLFCKPWDVLFSCLLKEMASWFSLATHWLLPDPNIVMAAGKHPVGGNVVTPIFLTPRRYRFYHKNLDKSRVGSDEKVGEPIRGVGSVEYGVDVVVLNEVTASCTQEVDST
ncbi:unnamed protein product [Camellia sinensis]